MAKALFLSLPLHGHTNPTLPLIRELIGRGEEVVYFSRSEFAGKIERTGACYRSYRNEFLAQLTRLPEPLEELPLALMRTTAQVLDEELASFRAEQPDYVICDSVAPWGPCVGELLGVPVVTSVSTFALNARVLAYGAARGVRPKTARLFFAKLGRLGRALALRRLIRRRHGVAPHFLWMICGHSALNIVHTSRAFQPCEESFDDRFLFVGPAIAPRADAGDFPWEQVRHPVLVYVSMGTLFNADAHFYAQCFDAFRDVDCQVILSLGKNVPTEGLGPAPANFIVRPHVPQLEVLARSTAFVTHGGMNSVSESLWFGVPMVVIPQMGEQAIVGRRVEELGAGLYLVKEETTATGLRTLVQRLLVEKSFREGAPRVRDSFQQAGGVGRAADAIIAFSRNPRP